MRYRKYLVDGDKVLEIGSGTGQHALYFANNLPFVMWQPSDLEDNHPGMLLWLQEAVHGNILEPLVLDVREGFSSTYSYNAVFTANTMHIMSWEEVLQMINVVDQSLLANGHFIVYGPFSVDGEYTSASNKAFDQHLKSIKQHMGIRDLEDIAHVCENRLLQYLTCYDMPANNKLVLFKKRGMAP